MEPLGDNVRIHRLKVVEALDLPVKAQERCPAVGKFIGVKADAEAEVFGLLQVGKDIDRRKIALLDKGIDALNQTLALGFWEEFLTASFDVDVALFAVWRKGVKG